MVSCSAFIVEGTIAYALYPPMACYDLAMAVIYGSHTATYAKHERAKIHRSYGISSSLSVRLCQYMTRSSLAFAIILQYKLR